MKTAEIDKKEYNSKSNENVTYHRSSYDLSGDTLSPIRVLIAARTGPVSTDKIIVKVIKTIRTLIYMSAEYQILYNLSCRAQYEPYL